MLDHMEVLHGKVALVTGASSGIGEAIARLLVIVGVHVIGLARRDERLNEIAKSLRGSKGVFYPYPGDVRNESSILDALGFAEIHFKGIDILINNAGIMFGETIIDGTTAHFRDVLNTNLLAAAITSREAIKSMRGKSGTGHIINIDSVLGLNPTPSNPPYNTGLYAAGSAGLLALTQNVRQEMAQSKTKIKVTAIFAGLVNTRIYAKGGIPQKVMLDQPHLEPVDIADTVLYALTRRGNVQVDGLAVTALY